MTDNLGTLAGLIADLEEFVKPWRGDANDYFTEDLDDLIRKHKRGQYRPIEDSWGCFVYKLGDPDGIIFRGETLAECEAWIEAQVNG